VRRQTVPYEEELFPAQVPFEILEIVKYVPGIDRSGN